MELTVECQTRPEGSKPRALRREGRIPANLYGHQGTESVSLALDAKTAERLVKAAAVNNTLINLNVTDMPWKGKTLLREVQVHPAKRSLYHLSFFAVAGHGDTDVEVPIHFVGEAVGVKQGGIIDTVVTTLSVRCQPESIPDAIEVDVSNLNVGDSILVENLNLPEGVTTSIEPNQVVVSILGQQASAEPVETQSESESATS